MQKGSAPSEQVAEPSLAIAVYGNLHPSHLSEVRKRQKDYVQYPDLTHPPYFHGDT